MLAELPAHDGHAVVFAKTGNQGTLLAYSASDYTNIRSLSVGSGLSFPSDSACS